MNMSPTTLSSPLRHLLRDTGLGAIVCILSGVVIALVNGEPHHLFKQIVYSLCVGMIALPAIDGARLAIWRVCAKGRARWGLLLLVVVVAAPMANYLGALLGDNLYGYPHKGLDDFTSMRGTSMMVFTMLAACMTIVLFIHRERLIRARADVATERARAERVERQAMQAQLQLLQAQIEPHMLFNTLANLQGLIAIDPDRATHMLDQLIQYLRATLSSSRAGATTLEHEFSLIDAYLGLMSIRMGARLRYSLDLPPALRRCPVPPMLLQPLVENAIIHGLEPSIDGGHIAVRASSRDGSLALAVHDTGVGPDGQGGTSGTRLGLANTRERLHGLYGERASLRLEPASGQGTLATITLPLEPA